MKSINRQGFTLIELSIVLVILGLIVGTVAPLIISMTKKNKLSSGRQLVTTARDEIKGDFIRNRTLATNLNNIGHSIDPWQNRLVYIPAPDLAGIDLCRWLAEGTGQTGLSVCLDGDCTTNKKENIAFVVASIGHNFNRQLETPVNSDGNSADLEVRLYSYGTAIDRYTTPPDINDATDQFDDIVQYVSVDELTQLVNCSVNINNGTGQTVCFNGAALHNGVDIGVLHYNQVFSLGATSDACSTIDSSCQIDYETALLADADSDSLINLVSVPPACSLGDM